MSSIPVMIAALWLSFGAALAVGVVSLSAGTAPEWVVLRAVGAFSALMVLGLVAEGVASHGLRQPVSRAGPAGPERRPAAPPGPLEPDRVTTAERQERGDA